MGGSTSRMLDYACYVAKELDQPFKDDKMPHNYACTTDRYVVYKVGPVLFVSVSFDQFILLLRIFLSV